MNGPSEAEVDRAIKKLKMIIEAAENSNHQGEVAVVRAANAFSLESALRLVAPEIKNSISCGDGRFTADQIDAIDQALFSAAGVSVEPQRVAA